MEVDKNNFLTKVNMFEVLFYSHHISLIMVSKEYEEGELEAYNIIRERFSNESSGRPTTF